MRSNRLLTAIVFLVGCATGGVASQVVAPPASAQGTNKQMWEYRCLDLKLGTLADPARDLPMRLNEAGGEGWELVAFSREGHPCLKRTLP